METASSSDVQPSLGQILKLSAASRKSLMRNSGVKSLDPVMETAQIDWLIVPIEECRDTGAEERLISSYFRKPHEACWPNRAFVMPVCIRRSRSRVLFSQQSGLE
jgi:hypothetical protein